MSNFVNQLLAIYEIRDIETAFVQFFIDRNNIKVTRNNLIKSIIHNNKENIKSAIKNHEPQDFDLYDLINIFELLIPEKDRNLNGAFFTPKKITKFIVKNTIKSKNQTIYDPSCGCGAFLIETTDYINKKYRKKVIDIIENNIYGTDIAEYSIERAKILLTLLALQNNEDNTGILFNLNNVDSLESRLDILYPKIIKGGGFDVVIGNPPYVKFQDLDIKTRGNLYTNWQTLKKGNYNLYFAFFELGMNALKKDGILGYIAPNNYFTSIAGVHLREYLESNMYINRIIDFNHLMLFDAQTYTCITFLEKTKKDYFYYARIDNYENLNNLNNLNHHIDYSRIKYSEINNKKWRLLKDVDQENIRKIESTEHKLGSVVDIRVGIATCKDAVYFIDGNMQKAGYYKKKYKDTLYLIEHNITKPIVKISDYKDQEGLNQNKRRIIFPYKKVDGRVEAIPEDELKNNFPECYRYLLAVKDELSTRDKGKIKYPQWYAYARTQGLNYFGEKLFTPTFSSKPRFLREKNPDTLFCNGYAVYLKQSLHLFPIIQNLDLDILSKILNSKIMEYYIKRTSVSIEGGYPCYQKNFIELFGIPNFTENEFKFLRDENNKEKIDEFLIKKYQVQF